MNKKDVIRLLDIQDESIMAEKLVKIFQDIPALFKKFKDLAFFELLLKKNKILVLEKFVEKFPNQILAKDKKGNTLLHLIVKRKNIPAIQQTISILHILSEEKNKNGHTPVELAKKIDKKKLFPELDAAIMAQKPEWIIRILDSGLDELEISKQLIAFYRERKSKKFSLMFEQGTIFHLLLAKNKFLVLIAFLCEFPRQVLQTNNQKQTILHCTVQQKNTVLVDTIVKLCPELIDIQDANGQTVLEIAKNKNFKDLAEIITSGQSVLTQKIQLEKILNSTEKQSSLVQDLISMLQQNQTLLDITFDSGQTIFHLLLKRNMLRVLQGLLSKFPIHALRPDGVGRNLMHYAVIYSREYAVSIISSDLPELIESKDWYGQTPWDLAQVTEGIIEQKVREERIAHRLKRIENLLSIPDEPLMLRLLLQAFNKDNSLFELKFTEEKLPIFHYLLQKGKMQVLKIFLCAFWSVLKKDDEHQTILHYAIENQKFEEACQILSLCPHLRYYKDYEGNNILDLAGDPNATVQKTFDVIQKRQELLKFVIKKYSEESSIQTKEIITYFSNSDNASLFSNRYLNGQTILQRLLAHQNFSLLKVLMCRFPSEAVKSDALGRTLLHHAVMMKNEEALKIILSVPQLLVINGYDHIDVQDCFGNTPLHLAALDCPQFIPIIIEQTSPDWTLKNHEGKTALELFFPHREVFAVSKLINSVSKIEKEKVKKEFPNIDVPLPDWAGTFFEDVSNKLQSESDILKVSSGSNPLIQLMKKLLENFDKYIVNPAFEKNIIMVNELLKLVIMRLHKETLSEEELTIINTELLKELIVFLHRETLSSKELDQIRASLNSEEWKMLAMHLEAEDLSVEKLEQLFTILNPFLLKKSKCSELLQLLNQVLSKRSELIILMLHLLKSLIAKYNAKLDQIENEYHFFFEKQKISADDVMSKDTGFQNIVTIHPFIKSTELIQCLWYLTARIEPPFEKVSSGIVLERSDSDSFPESRGSSTFPDSARSEEPRSESFTESLHYGHDYGSLRGLSHDSLPEYSDLEAETVGDRIFLHRTMLQPEEIKTFMIGLMQNFSLDAIVWSLAQMMPFFSDSQVSVANYLIILLYRYRQEPISECTEKFFELFQQENAKRGLLHQRLASENADIEAIWSLRKNLSVLQKKFLKKSFDDLIKEAFSSKESKRREIVFNEIAQRLIRNTILFYQDIGYFRFKELFDKQGDKPFLDYFNRLSSYLKCIVLSHSTDNLRNAVESLIGIMSKLYVRSEKNQGMFADFNSLMILSSVLNHVSVSRLIDCADLDLLGNKKTRDIWEDVSKLIDSRVNFSEMRNFQKKFPALPHRGLISKDITPIAENSQEFWDRFLSIGKIIRQYMKLTQNVYTADTTESIQFVLSQKVVNEDVLWNLSCSHRSKANIGDADVTKGNKNSSSGFFKNSPITAATRKLSLGQKLHKITGVPN